MSQIGEDLKQGVIIKVKDLINTGEELELDLDDFVEIYVGTKTTVESNEFLNSLWREFDQQYAAVGQDKCPWAFLPQKSIDGQRNITYFGSMRTADGYMHAAISYRKKGSIDNIYFYIMEHDNKEQLAVKWRYLVKRARKRQKIRYDYSVTYGLSGYAENKIALVLEEYTGENFKIHSKENGSEITFQILAHDKYSAENLAQQKIRQVTNFLTVETNVCYRYRILQIELGEAQADEKVKKKRKFQKDCADVFYEDGKFIDGIAVYDDKILLSEEGIAFLDLLTDKEWVESKQQEIFLSSCYHFREGLKHELQLQEIIGVALDESIIRYVKKEQQERQGIMDISLTLYLSAMETITLIGRKIEKCHACGQLKYEIRKSVCDFINFYLWDGMGDVFKRIYDLRSVYLHAGKTTNTSLFSIIRPMLDDTTGTGCTDLNFITMNVNGNVIEVTLVNVREWVSYALRNFYKETLL